ncbi:MAG: c-type cytochrome [Bauldia sp.]|nr:c-type cytochrome [Bauldia sp.]MCW5717307.1 c-type cytochrome [Bauldia sp.]
MRRLRVVLAAGLVAGLSVLGLVGPVTTATAQMTPTWTANIGPLFAANCTNCHSGAGRAGLRLNTYANAIAGGNSGPALIAGNPAGSLLMQRITGQVPPQMPRGGTPLSAADIAMVAAWIQAGMPE